MQRLCPALIFLFLTVAAIDAQEPASPATDSSTYCLQTEAYAEHHMTNSLWFSAVPQNRDPALDHWTRVASYGALQSATENANSTAVVTVRDGHVVWAALTFQNQFGDSSETAGYCYREDGTLAQLDSELKSFHDGVRVVREFKFDGVGKQISKTEYSFDLTTGKLRSIPGDFWDQPTPVFLHVRNLPFGRELP